MTLDIYKGVLIILVVIRHVLQNVTADEGGILTNFIWAVQMPGFMIVSGYFSAKVINNGKDILTSFRKSTERYAMPFLTWFILVNVLLLGRYERNPISSLVDLLQRVDKGLWFLWTVFILSLIATICNYALNKGKNVIGKIIYVGISCIFCFGILFSVAMFTNINMFGIKYVLYYAVFYGFGWIVKSTERYWKDKVTVRVKDVLLFFCLVIFLAIVFNYDLYHCEDDLLSISLRCIAGFTGNAIIVCGVDKYKEILTKCKISWIGKYTLEIYVTHMCAIKLFKGINTYDFWTLYGFDNFMVTLICTVIFTTIIIAVFKSIPVANYLMFGKRSCN